MTNWTTDKVELGYIRSYEEIYARLESTWVRPFTILEVGVASGAGMDMFRDLFRQADVYGVDINPDAGRPDQRDRTVIASQDDPGLPLVLATTGWGGFNLIVDDASHLAGPTAVTLANLWPQLLPGGCYVIEDWNFFEGPGMAQNLWQKLFGNMLAYPSVGDRRTTPNPYSGALDGVESVTIRDGMIIIWKYGPDD